MSIEDMPGELFFPPSSAKVGMPYSLADHLGANTSIGLKKYIRNALDSRVANAGNKAEGPCRVLMKTSTMPSSEIPGIGAYRKALQMAMNNWSENESVRNYLQRLEEQSSKKEVAVLFLTDNGAGLDENGIQAALCEESGLMKKVMDAPVDFRHTALIALSGLQYIFHLGRRGDGRMIAAGHAIMSSFEDDNGVIRSEHGYFLKGFRQTFIDPFVFCGEDEIPGFLLREQCNLGTSNPITAVLGFKGFSKECECVAGSNLAADECFQSTIEDFALAICSNELSLECRHELSRNAQHCRFGDRTLAVEMSQRLDSGHLIDTFKQWMARTKPPSENTSLNQKTIATLATFFECEKKVTLQEKFSDCTILLRRSDVHDVSIWRNGRMVTRSYRGLSRRHFSGKRPFNALILLNGRSEEGISHDLIRDAESPFHGRLEPKRLRSRKNRVLLSALIKEIREWLLLNS